MTSRLLLVLLFGFPLFAQDYFIVDPPRPYEGEEVAVRIGGAWPSGAAPRTPHVSIDGNVISTNDIRLWAFVTVTNNETQHVTTYSPQ